MSLLNDFRRLKKRERCPVCSHADWCLVARDGEAVICARAESGRRMGSAGWLHGTLNGHGLRAPRECRIAYAPGNKDLTGLAARFEEALCEAELARLASSLGLSSESLRALGVGLVLPSDMEGLGFRGHQLAFSFPMEDGRGNVCGIRLRLENGKKFAVRGGHEGIFVPRETEARSILFLVEGPTDAAAMLDLGLLAIGRPNCCGGVKPVCRLIHSLRAEQVVVVADADRPGISGAEHVAQATRCECADVRVIQPPSGHKDIREWTAAGADKEQVLELVANASQRELIAVNKEVAR